jgi:hypothetical protein
MAIADRIEHQAVLVAQAVLLLLVGKAPGQLVPIRARPFSDAATTDKHLSLQEQLAFAGLALHVIDGVTLLDIRVKAENHAFSFNRLEKRLSPIN